MTVMKNTISVWENNFKEEMMRFNNCLKNFPMIALDTEFPGTIYETQRYVSDVDRYKKMKSNIEETILIQCGFTLFNSTGEIGGIWEVNFSNFNFEDRSHKRNESSLEFLIKQGLNLKKIRDQGVDMFSFFPKLFNLIRLHKKRVEFVTFHGATDLAYILSALNKGKIANTVEGFVSSIEETFGEVYDLKVMAGFCDGFGEHLGLAKVANLLQISRTGEAHHAGSDSLITAQVFVKLTQLYQHCKLAKGTLYGIQRIVPEEIGVDVDEELEVLYDYDHPLMFIATPMFPVPMNVMDHEPINIEIPFRFPQHTSAEVRFPTPFACHYAPPPPPPHYFRF